MPEVVPVLGRQRYIGAVFLVTSGVVALAHGFYFMFVNPHTILPFMNPLSMGLAGIAFWASWEAVRGRRFLLVISVPILLLTTAIWDVVLAHICWCMHQPVAVYILIPMIVGSELSFITARNEFHWPDGHPPSDG